MAATTWLDNRYRDLGGPHTSAQSHYAGHFFLFVTPTGSGVSHMLDMSGLATPPTAPDAPRRPRPVSYCGAAGGEGAEALIAQREVAIVAIGYRIDAATIIGSELSIQVTPGSPQADRGYHIVQVARPSAPNWTARFVLADGATRACGNSRRILAAEPPADC
jgi:hypothetical protein